MKRFISLVGLICLNLMLFACQRAQDELTPQDDSNEYVTATLSVGGENGMRSTAQGLRAYFNSPTPYSLAFTFGPAGSTVVVQTQIYAVHTLYGSKEIKLVGQADLPWTVTGAQSTKLSFEGQMKISKKALTGAERLILYATIKPKTGSTFYSTALFELPSTSNTLELEIPYALLIDLEVPTTDGTTLRVKSGSKPVFKGLGEVMIVRISTEAQNDLYFTGISGQMSPNKTFQYATFGTSDINKADGSQLTHIIAEDPTPTSDPSMGSNVPQVWINKKRVMALSEREYVAIHPYEAKLFIAWTPSIGDNIGVNSNNYLIHFLDPITNTHNSSNTLVRRGHGSITLLDFSDKVTDEIVENYIRGKGENFE